MYLGRSITFKSRDGMLHSRLPIGDILREKLGKRVSKGSARIIKVAQLEQWVIYRKDILADKELDEKLARDLGCIYDLPLSSDRPPKVRICHPNTIQFLRDFKTRPVKLAKEFCREDVTKALFDASRPADFRRKWYEIFNLAMAIDKKTKDINHGVFNICLYLPSLFIGLSDVGEAFRKLADTLWLYPDHHEERFSAWYSYFFTSPKTGPFEEEFDNIDRKFLVLLNDLMEENKNLIFRNRRTDRP